MRRVMQVFTIAAVCLGASASVQAQSAQAAQGAFQQAVSLFGQGQFEQAATAFQKILDAQPSNGPAWLYLGLCAHQQKDYDAALERYEKAAGFPRLRATALYNTGCANALLGRAEPALDALVSAVEAGFTDASLMKTDTDLESVRDSERFQTIVDSIGVPLSRRLHFWIGEWDCYSAASGQLNGRNNMVSRLNGSVIHENWTPEGGGAPGESWNFFDPQTNTWRQDWVTGNGAVTMFVGKPRENGIFFEATGVGNNGQQTITGMFVRPIGAGRVRQTGTFSPDGGKTWQPRYDLIYVPRGEPFNVQAAEPSLVNRPNGGVLLD